MLNYRKHSRTNAAKTNHKVTKPKTTTKLPQPPQKDFQENYVKNHVEKLLLDSSTKIEECNGGALNAAQCDPLWLPITDVIC